MFPHSALCWVVVVGLILGICWLYRPDYGTTELLASLVFLGLVEASERREMRPGFLRALGLFLVGFSVFPLAWCVYLIERLDTLAPLRYLELTIQATRAVSSGMSQPLPSIRSLIVAYWLIPTSYLWAMIAVWQRGRAGKLDARSWFLLATALVGTASLHQAMHRMGPLHLLQVIPAAIVSASLIVSWLLRGVEGVGSGARVKPWSRVAGVGYATLLVVVGLKLSQWGQCDLEKFAPWPLYRYRGLARPLGEFDGDSRTAALSTVTKLTDPRDSILVFPLDCQFYALTKRRISGRHNAYYAASFRLAAG